MVRVVVQVEVCVGCAAYAVRARDLHPQPRLLAGVIPVLDLNIALCGSVALRDRDLLPVSIALKLVEDKGDIVAESSRGRAQVNQDGEV